MRAYDIIKKKRDGFALTHDEIYFFIEKYVAGEIPDYQAAAFCMAVYFQSMTDEETAFLTMAMRDSGEIADFSKINGVRADKHSTGGVGDKTSLVVAPAVAACGVKVAKMSGRGLGHTGGTVDKIEAIPGVKTNLDKETFIDAVNKTGMAIIAQSGEFAPADKLLYGLRDVTATVDSIPLIASSIMSKKLALNDDCIVLDVKVGSGAFMKSIEDSVALAKTMINIAKHAGKKATAFVTNMNVPLGNAIGNALEVREALEILQGQKKGELYNLCVSLASEMLYLAKKGTREECKKQIENAISTGKALEVFANAVEAQGGDKNYVYNLEKLKLAPKKAVVKSDKNGYISKTNAEEYGKASVLLGAGRNKIGEKIDLGAGIYLLKKQGDKVKKGEPIAELYSSDESKFAECTEIIKNATELTDTLPKKEELIFEIIE